MVGGSLRSLVLFSVWILVAAGCGLLGRWVGERRAVPALAEPVGSAASSHAAVPPPPPAVPRPALAAAPVLADPALVACKAELATCVAATAEVRTDAEGTEVPWSDAVPDDERPDAVKAMLKRVRKDCPAFAHEPTYLDCDEYPCIVWTETTRPLEALEPSDLPDLYSCPDWPFSAYSTHLGGASSSGEITILQAFPAVSADALQDDLRKRIQFRAKSGQSVAQQALEESP